MLRVGSAWWKGKAARTWAESDRAGGINAIGALRGFDETVARKERLRACTRRWSSRAQRPSKRRDGGKADLGES